jgi:VIT1/CCC1 family predicted Fe2+/Mn2+ transporter
VKRGLDEPLAELVSTQLTAKDALAAYARDELGISEELAARPVQAAFASAGVGALFGARLSIADRPAALIIVDHLGLFAA